jgi:hypothetical protein
MIMLGDGVSVLKDFLLFFIAIWGAVLATIQWIQSRKDMTRKLAVSVSLQTIEGDNRKHERFVQVSVLNEGTRPVTIQAIGLESQLGKKLPYFHSELNVDLPKVLLDGEIVGHLFPSSEINQFIAADWGIENCNLRGFCVDASNKQFSSRFIETAELVRMVAYRRGPNSAQKGEDSPQFEDDDQLAVPAFLRRELR